MKRLKSENRRHIKELFSVKAGVALPTPRPRIKTAALLASVILCFAVLAGFSKDLVSDLAGGEPVGKEYPIPAEAEAHALEGRPGGPSLRNGPVFL